MEKLKKRCSYFLFSALIALLATSCSDKSEQLLMIPNDAIVVVTFDAKAILTKSGLDKSDNSLRKLLEEKAKGEVPAVFEEIMKDPAKSPISLTDEMFFFVNENYTGFTAKTGNEEYMKNVLREVGVDDFESKSGYNIAALDYSSVCIWNKQNVLIVNATEYDKREGVKDYADKLFTQKKDASILSKSGFSDFYGKKKDVSARICFDNLPSEAKREIKSGFGSEFDFDLSELEVGFFLSFNKGETALEVNLLKLSDNLKKKIKEYSYGEKFSGNLLKYLPEQTIIAVAGSLNGEKIYNALSGMNNRDFEYAEKSMKDENVDLKKLLSSFKGDIVFSLYDIVNDVPTFTFLAETKDDYAVKTIVEIAQKQMGESVSQKENGIYSIDIDGVKAAFGTTGKYLFFTMNESAVNDIKNGYSKSLADSKLKSEMTKTFGYGYLNLNWDNFPESTRNTLKEMMSDEFGAGEIQLITGLSSKYLNSVSLATTSETSGVLTLKFADEKENGAKIMVKVIADMIERFM